MRVKSCDFLLWPAVIGIVYVALAFVVLSIDLVMLYPSSEDFASILVLSYIMFGTSIVIQLVPYIDCAVHARRIQVSKRVWYRVIGELVVCTIPIAAVGWGAVAADGGIWMLSVLPVFVNLYLMAVIVLVIGRSARRHVSRTPTGR
jgi:hypothetical protein